MSYCEYDYANLILEHIETCIGDEDCGVESYGATGTDSKREIQDICSDRTNAADKFGS